MVIADVKGCTRRCTRVAHRGIDKYVIHAVQLTDPLIKFYVGESTARQADIFMRMFSQGSFHLGGYYCFEQFLGEGGDVSGFFTRQMLIEIILEQHVTQTEAADMSAPAKVIPSDNIDPWDQLEKMVNIVSKLMPKQEPIKNQTEVLPELMKQVGSSYIEGITKMQEAMINKSVETMDRMGEVDPTLTEDQNKAKNEVIDLICKFGNRLLNSKGKQAENYKELITNDDLFKTVEKDKVLFSAIYTDMCQQKNIGKKYANELFKKIGFKIPG